MYSSGTTSNKYITYFPKQTQDYFATANQFPTGAIQLKALTLTSGQVHVQKYWHCLLELIQKGEFDPTFIITHRLPFERIVEAYKMFANYEDGCVKVILHTPFYYERIKE
jgi:threonine dehydrogenase-like Zn-dependent dehydrogenase